MIRILLLCFLLSSCSPKINYGTVVGKRYEPPQSIVVRKTHRLGTQFVIIEEQVFDDEDYYIMVEGHDKNGKLVSDEWKIDYYHYLELEIGDLVKKENK